MNNLVFKHQEGLEFLEGIPDNSVDLILTDPPYITSRDSGMDDWVKHVERQDSEGAENVKTEEDWEKLKTPEQWDTWFSKSKISEEDRPEKFKEMKEDFLKYGSIYGKKYAVTTNYGKWDSEFTLEKMDLFAKHFYRVLRPGGTCIIFFDIWKLTDLKDIMDRSGPMKNRPIPNKPKKNESEEDFLARKKEVLENPYKQHGFTKLRFIEWIKTNPQPINSSATYLSNCREIALVGVKSNKSAVFNSKYDNAIYKHPIQGNGKNGEKRFHPTQKNLLLFQELIEKHSNEGDLVLDCFTGSGTTAIAAIKTSRRFSGCELEKEYYEKASARIERHREKMHNDLVKELNLIKQQEKEIWRKLRLNPVSPFSSVG
jgi:site-specific DNA-methyltransferase (adenine-specific)